MKINIKGRTYHTHFIEKEEPPNLRIIAEVVAKNLLKGDLKND